MRGISEEFAGKSLADFFNNYIYSTKELDYSDLVNYAGLELVKEDDEEEECLERIGIKFGRGNFGAIAKVQPESDAYNAGLQKGDEVIAIDKNKASLDNAKNIMDYLKDRDNITISFFRNGVLCEANIKYSIKASWKYTLKKKKMPV